MGTADYVIIAVILLWIAVSVVILIKRKKNGKGICGGDCSHCKMCDGKKRIIK